tara:strand:+ start:228 stop:1229 length:1002 start_codon:yes stop_codon:yes gene_type:complete
MISNDEKKLYINKFLKYNINNNNYSVNNYIKNNYIKNNYIKNNHIKNNHTNKLFIIIPKGIKALIWFTYINNKNICLLIFINHNNSISKIEPYHICFSDDLAYGTILYGTYLHVNNEKYFVCEDIFYFKNTNVMNFNFKKKLYILNDIFNNKIKYTFYTNNSIIITLSIMNLDYSYISSIVNTLSYKVFAIKYIDYTLNNYIIGFERIKDFFYKEAIFKIKASIQPDIYYLYCLNNNEETYYNIAYISSYKKSIFMNKLFRNIKENDNLDLLEESDSDSDFEDTSNDKYVDLNKSFYMLCYFNKQFTKWEPCKISNYNKISDYNNILKLEQTI